MARPLREQFVLATLLLLIPVSGVIVWAFRSTYNEQVKLIRLESQQTAETIAAYLYATRSDRNQVLTQFLDKLPIPDGTAIEIRDSHGLLLVSRPATIDQAIERVPDQAFVRELGWRVTVGVPFSLAWSRTVPINRRTVGITALATLIMLLLEGVFARRWIRSLTHFQQAADRVGRGDLQTPPLEVAT